MLSDYQIIGKDLGIAEHKIEKWWHSLNPKEREGMKRLALAGMGGVALAAAMEYNPDAIPLAMIPLNAYVHRKRFQKIAEKLHLVHQAKEKGKLKKVV